MNKQYTERELELFEEIKAIIVDIMALEEDQIQMTSNFRDDLGADSLDLVELIMAFEDEFGGQIPDEDVSQITSVEEAVRYVQDRMEKGA